MLIRGDDIHDNIEKVAGTRHPVLCLDVRILLTESNIKRKTRDKSSMKARHDR